MSVARPIKLLVSSVNDQAFIQANFDVLAEAGGEVHPEIKNVGGARLVARVTDAAGIESGLRQD